MRAALHGDGVRDAPAVGVEQGYHVDDDIVVAKLERERRVDAMHVQAAMCEGYAFGPAGGAAGIKQFGDVIFVKLGRHVVGGAGGQQRLVFMGRQPARLALNHHKMLGG